MTVESMDVRSPLAVFDALRRGEAAPDWIREGIAVAWGPSDGSLEATLIAVSENATFRVIVGGVPTMVVRLHRPGYVGDVANVRSELLWVEAISRETGVRTPAPLRGADGELVQTLDGPGGSSWTAVAFEFAPGRILEELPDQPSYFGRIGALTAVLHEHARSWERPSGFRRFDWTLADMVGPEARWGSWERAALSDDERELLRRARSAALIELAEHEPSPATWGLIHSDLRPSNIMFHGADLTVIDFDDSGFSYYLYDFASALTFYEHTPEARDMAANWLDGYREVLPLSAADLRAAGALSLIRRLTMLGWATTHREDALPPELWNANLPGSVEVAARYLEDPLWLADPS